MTFLMLLTMMIFHGQRILLKIFRVFLMKKLILLKIGGSVITDKNKSRTAKLNVIKRISSEISNAMNNKDFSLVLVNGVGSFGHIPVKEYGLKKGIRDDKTKLGFTLVHKYVEDLNRILWDSLEEEGLIAMPVHPSCFVVQNDWKILKFDTSVIELLLDKNIIPLLYGDMVLDLKNGCSIISGDDIIPYLAKKLNPDKVLMGSNTDGIFDKDPTVFPNSKLIPRIDKKNYKDILDCISGSSSADVTGGMREKVRKIFERLEGKECIIFNAEKKGFTERVLLGEKIGTIISC